MTREHCLELCNGAKSLATRAERTNSSRPQAGSRVKVRLEGVNLSYAGSRASFKVSPRYGTCAPCIIYRARLVCVDGSPANGSLPHPRSEQSGGWDMLPERIRIVPWLPRPASPGPKSATCDRRATVCGTRGTFAGDRLGLLAKGARRPGFELRLPGLQGVSSWRLGTAPRDRL